MKRLFVLALLFFAAPSFAAICSVSEHRNLFMMPSGVLTPLPDAPYRTHSVTYTTATSTVTPFAARTLYIGISCTATAYYALGTSPTADGTSLIIPADTLVYIPVTAGHLISFYDGVS